MKPIYVKEVYNPQHMPSALVHANTPLEKVLCHFTPETWSQNVFVTDKASRLVGVITPTDLLEWTRLRLGMTLGDPAYEPDSVKRMARIDHIIGPVSLSRAITAADAIHPHSREARVYPDDLLDHALKLILRTGVVTIPVVDDEERIMSALTLSQILRYLLTRGVGYMNI